MARQVPAAFEMTGLRLAIEKVLPAKSIVTDIKKNGALQRVICSVREIGLVEPLIVYPQGTKRTMYLLLDGHLRLEAVKQLGWTEVPCLISTDDEAYTYNHKVNLVPPIQEHFMILKAIENGVSEAKIAASLNVDVATIRMKRDLIKGICPEAVALLKDKNTSRDMLRLMAKVKPIRQIEMAELMLNAGIYTSTYARGLLMATHDDQLLDPNEHKALPGLSFDDATRMEKEMQVLEQDLQAIEDSHNRNVLNLVLITAYLRKLLDNSAIAKFLNARHADVMAEFKKLVDSASLDR